MTPLHEFATDRLVLSITEFAKRYPHPLIVYYANQPVTAPGLRSPTSTQRIDKSTIGRLRLLRRHAHRYLVLTLSEKRELTFGRREESDIVLGEISVSREHAQGKWQNGALQIRDLGTTNGTWIGETQIPANEWRPVPFGEQMRLGEAHLMLFTPEQFYDALTELLAEHALSRIK